MLAKSSVRNLSHYELLGISPSSKPDVIDSAFQNLTRKYRDAGGEKERMRKLDSAYHDLKDPQRRRKYDATIGAATTTVAVWRIRAPPSSRDAASSESAEGLVAGRTAMAAVGCSASPIGAQPGAPPAGATPAHDTAVSGSNTAVGNSRVERIRAGPSPSTGDSSGSGSDPRPPTDSATEDRTPRGTFGWSRIALPLVAILAVTAAALSTQFLFDMPPALGGSDGQRESPATVGADQIGSPQKQAALQSTDRSDDQQLPMQSADQLPVSISEAGGQRGGAADSPQLLVPAPSAGAQVATASRAGSASSPSVSKTAAPALAPVTEQGSRPAPSAMAEAQSEPPEAIVEQAKPVPARWISGGLLDSDNPGGRFEGVVAVRIAVGANGRASGCRVAQSSGNPSLDEVTCRIVQPRLQFIPARDASGRPTDSEISTTYTWGRRPRRR